jgi:hypothetical protein
MYLVGFNDALYAQNFRSTQLIPMFVEDGITADLRHGQDSMLSIDFEIPFLTSQRFFRRLRALSFEYGGDGLHTLLNEAIRGNQVTLAWKCSRDLLIFCFQNIFETPLAC